MIEFQMAEDFFKDGIHHVGFSLSPFSDILLCIHGYHPTLICTQSVEPPF